MRCAAKLGATLGLYRPLNFQVIYNNHGFYTFIIQSEGGGASVAQEEEVQQARGPHHLQACQGQAKGGGLGSGS